MWLYGHTPEAADRDAEALPDGELQIIEAWPGSVQVEWEYVRGCEPQLHIDGVAIRVLGQIPPGTGTAAFELILPGEVNLARAAKGLPPIPGGGEWITPWESHRRDTAATAATSAATEAP